MHDLYIFLFTEWKEGNIHVLCVVEDHLHQNVVLLVLSPKFCTNIFSVNAIETDVFCNKCRHKCRIISRRKQISDINLNSEVDAKDPTFRSPKRSKCMPVSSAPSIALPLSSSSRCHSYCFVCIKPGSKLLSVTNQERMDVFVRKEKVIVIPPGERCCAGHLISGKLSDDAVQKIKTNDSVLLNRTAVLTMIDSLREMAIEHPRLDFDDESSMDDKDYKALKGFSRCVFQDIVSTVTSINSSKRRSKKICGAIIHVKLRSALSNKMLAVLFKMT